MEIWRNAPGHEGYQVSNEGNVKSLAKDVVYKDGRIRHYEEKLLKPVANYKGYLVVNLYKDGKKKLKKIHQLVAQAFIPNPLGLPEVNHKDEDKTNNRVENLEWCTHEYNINYGSRNQRVGESLKNSQKAKEHRSKLSEAQRKPVYQRTLNRILVKIWPSTKECGRNGFSAGAVSDCCNNKYMREGNNVYKNYIWEYADS